MMQSVKTFDCHIFTVIIEEHPFILPFLKFKLKCTCVLCQSSMTVFVQDRETEKENKCCFWARSIRELVSLLVCACVYKGGGCRQTGSRGLQNRTGHHNSSGRSLATDRQAGLNADGSLIGICHQQPTKSIYLRGETRPYSHTQINTHSTHTHTHSEHISNLIHTYSAHFWLITFIHTAMLVSMAGTYISHINHISSSLAPRKKEKRPRSYFLTALPIWPSFQ